MGDNQCGLCLSCGAPFMPDLSQTEFFNRDANLSILFLNTQFAHNPDIMRTYDVPKLCSERQASHMIHRSYHHTALDYMCNRLRGDRDVGNPGAMVAGYRMQDVANNAFLYYHTATGNVGPRAACWARPPRDQRLNMRPLLRAIQLASLQPEALPIPQSLAQTYDMCAGCNALMTQKSHMRFLLGVRGAGAKNQRGRILQQAGVIQQFDMTAGRNAPLDRAYGRWRVHRHPHGITSPNLVKADSDAPAIAYYLHLCLPFRNAGADGFQMLRANMRDTARAHYLQQCWLILEIACLATLLEENTVTQAHSRKSHGMHQHLGALDVYVSYFIWRMLQFRYAVIVNRRGMSFIEWHQKFYCDARNCVHDLLSAHDRRTTTGQLMYTQTDVPARTLVQTICRRLINYYRRDLSMLFRHIIGDALVSRQVKNYFVPVAALRALRDRSIQVRVLVYLFVLFFFDFPHDEQTKTVRPKRLPVGAGQLRDQRPALPAHRPVRGLPSCVSESAPRLPCLLAVARDRARPPRQPGPRSAGRLQALLPLHPPRPAQPHPRRQGPRRRHLPDARLLLALEQRHLLGQHRCLLRAGG